MKYLPENKEFLAILMIFLISIAFCCCIKAHCGSSRRFINSLHNYESQRIANELEISISDDNLPG